MTSEAASAAAVDHWPQVSRRGRRPLSAVVSSSSSRLAASSTHNPNVISPEDDSDSEQEARRLLRSQIIKSFWEQHDLEQSEQVPATEQDISIR